MELAKKHINNRTLTVVLGDITEEEVDAIVNAANSYLKHGGGVAGAIVRKGGKIIQEESDKIGYCPVGSAVYTSAGNLKAKYVIHAVGPQWGEGDEDEKLKNAVLSALKIAEELKCERISLPAISTGIFGFPKDRGTKIILNTCIDFLKNQANNLKEIRLCNIDRETCDYFLKHLEELSQ
uniref:Macro domain-containing protein n=1 Tax=candidate division WOR-3 bacterium TaxID=2052148 RepID=A0A7V3ZZT4_UNCW3